jgi:hypothetical protein
MSLPALEHAVLAVNAAVAGDGTGAADHISHARLQARVAARRERQVIEIAALVVAGQRNLAVGLAFEHLARFPADAALLAQLTSVDLPPTATELT